MAGSTGSRWLWAGLLAPPLLLLGGVGMLLLWPEQVVGTMDAVQRSWVAWTTSPVGPNPGAPPMGRPPFPSPSPAPPPPETVKLEGTVRTPDGRPLRGNYTLAAVHLKMGKLTPNGSEQVVGRSMGMISMGSLGAEQAPDFSVPLDSDTTFLVIRVEGYAPCVLGPYSHKASEARPGGDPVPVMATLAPGVSHVVRVVDDHGSPILGAEVAATLIVGRSSVRLPEVRHTDEDGRALFADLSEGDYDFEVAVYGFRLPDDAIASRVEQGGTTTIALERGPVPGVARDEEGRPVADAVLLIAAEMDERLEMEVQHPLDRIVMAKSDADGRFVLPALYRDSTYLIRANGPDGSLGFAPGVRRGGGEVQVTLRPMRTARGIVEADAPGQRPWVTVNRSIPTGFESRSSHAEARRVMAHSRGIQPDPEGRFEYPVWSSVDTELVVGGRSIPVPWPPPDEPLRIEVPVKSSPLDRTIRVQVNVEEGGGPIHGPMTLHLQNTPPERAHQDVTRQIELRESQGRFECMVGESFRYDSAAIPGHWTVPGMISPAPEGDRQVEVRTFPAASIDGRVVVLDGTPVTGETKIRVMFGTARPSDRPAPIPMRANTFMRRETPPDQDEKEAKDLPTYFTQPATEEATADADGRFEIARLPRGAKARLFAQRGRYGSPVMDIELEPQAPRATVEVRMPRQVGTSVRLVDPEGRPIAGARAWLTLRRSSTDFGRWPLGETDSDGRLAVDDLGEGETQYTLSFNFKADYQPMSVPLIPGAPTQELRAKRGKTLEVRVVEAITGWPIPGLMLWARSPEDGTDAEATTDADGRVRFSTLSDGPVRLEDRRQLKCIAPLPTVVPGSTEPVLIRLIQLRQFDPQPRPFPQF